MLDYSVSETKTSLEEELLRLRNKHESVHAIFREEKAVIQRKLNTITSPTHRLPFETLNIIFLHAVRPPPRPSSFDKWGDRPFQPRDLEDIFFSVILAAVCSRWRSVALSTPQLWTYFEFPDILWTRRDKSCHLLLLYLKNSKHLPIHLSLSFSASDERNNSLFHPSLDRSLISDSARIRSLLLYNPPLRWLKQLKNLPFITDLEIAWPFGIRNTGDRLQVHHCHTLSRLSLHYAVPENNSRVLYQAPSSLTVLDLSTIPIDICIKIMLRCRNLIEAYIHEPQEEQDTDILVHEEISSTWFPQPIVFNHLTILVWSQINCVWADAFLERMETPQLHTLKWAGTDDEDEFRVVHAIRPGHASLIGQLPTTLKRLEIEGFYSIGIDTLGRLVNAQSSVEHLVLTGCTLEVVSDIFDALLKIEGASKLFYFPLLKFLSVRNCLEDSGGRLEEFKTSDLISLIESLERRLRQGDSFRLEFSDLGVDWTTVAQTRLRRLFENGAHLDIIDDGRQVEWLQPI